MKHVTQRIQAYLDGELTPPAVQALEEHLRGCAACRQELEAGQGLWRQVEAAMSMPDRASLWPRLADRLERRRRRRGAWTFRGLGLAAALTGLLLGWQLGQPAAAARRDGVLKAETGYLEDSLPSLDQLWLQAGINGSLGS